MSLTTQMQNRPRALRVIQALRDGSNCLEGVEQFSAGREAVFRAAEEVIDELEITHSAVVRWLKGRYGHGKTHTFARLMAMAHRRNWVTTYVQVSGPGEGADLSRFNEIYSSIVQNCLCKQMVEHEEGQVNPGRLPGWKWILDQWFESLKRQSGSATSGGVPRLILHDVINQTMTSLQQKKGIHGSFAQALRQYAIWQADNESEMLGVLHGWFRGEDVHKRGGDVRKRLREAGIVEPVNRRNAKEMLRHMSAFLGYRGYKGFMILLDEVENVLRYTPKSRRTAYTHLRELIDNVDDRHGMVSTCCYAAGTPDLFDGDKGFTEYEALAARVLLPTGGDTPNPMASLVDLSRFPLCEADLLAMAQRVVEIYSVAKNRPMSSESQSELSKILKEALKENPDLNARQWIRLVVDTLDRNSNNP